MTQTELLRHYVLTLLRHYVLAFTGMHRTRLGTFGPLHALVLLTYLCAETYYLGATASGSPADYAASFVLSTLLILGVRVSLRSTRIALLYAMNRTVGVAILLSVFSSAPDQLLLAERIIGGLSFAGMAMLIFTQRSAEN